MREKGLPLERERELDTREGKSLPSMGVSKNGRI